MGVQEPARTTDWLLWGLHRVSVRPLFTFLHAVRLENTRHLGCTCIHQRLCCVDPWLRLTERGVHIPLGRVEVGWVRGIEQS